MICGLCQNSFNPESQSPGCPHLNLDPPPPRAGGPRLRAEFQREIEDAYNLRNADSLRPWLFHENYAARFYAQHLLKRLLQEELDKSSQLHSNNQ